MVAPKLRCFGTGQALDEAGRNGRYDKVVDYRARIAVVLAAHRLGSRLPLTLAVTDGEKFGTEAGWAKLNAAAAVAAFSEIDTALDKQARRVRKLRKKALAN